MHPTDNDMKVVQIDPVLLRQFVHLSRYPIHGWWSQEVRKFVEIFLSILCLVQLNKSPGYGHPHIHEDPYQSYVNISTEKHLHHVHILKIGTHNNDIIHVYIIRYVRSRLNVVY